MSSRPLPRRPLGQAKTPAPSSSSLPPSPIFPIAQTRDLQAYSWLGYILQSLNQLPPGPRKPVRLSSDNYNFYSPPARWSRPTFTNDFYKPTLWNRQHRNFSSDTDSSDTEDSDFEMASQASERRSSRLPSEPFHMNTRRRSKKTTSTYSNALSAPSLAVAIDLDQKPAQAASTEQSTNSASSSPQTNSRGRPTSLKIAAAGESSEPSRKKARRASKKAASKFSNISQTQAFSTLPAVVPELPMGHSPEPSTAPSSTTLETDKPVHSNYPTDFPVSEELTEPLPDTASRRLELNGFISRNKNPTTTLWSLVLTTPASILPASTTPPITTSKIAQTDTPVLPNPLASLSPPDERSETSRMTTRRRSKKTGTVSRKTLHAPTIQSGAIIDPEPMEIEYMQKSTRPSLTPDVGSPAASTGPATPPTRHKTNTASTMPHCPTSDSDSPLTDLSTTPELGTGALKRKREEDDDEIAWLRPKNPIFYGADFRPRKQAASNDSPSGTNSPARKTRGGGGARKRGGKPGNGRGGRGRARGGGRAGRGGGDSPDRKAATDPEAKALLASMKARQQDLKKFFSHVGSYQIDTLEGMSTKDISQLQRKPNAHKKLAEHEALLESLDQSRKGAEDQIQVKYRLAEEVALREYEAEKWILEERCKRIAQEARTEHIKGAEGDIELLRNAHATWEDDNHTEAGSHADEDAGQLPRLHEALEPGSRVRGYSSLRIHEEKSLRYLYTANKLAPSTDKHADQARREVMEEDILSPVKRAFFEKVGADRDLAAKRKTQNMDMLSSVAGDELKKISGYLLPRGLTSNELNSFALSNLADMAEWAQKQHPDKMYMFMPLPTGERPALAAPAPPAPPKPAQQRPQQQFIFQRPIRGGFAGPQLGTPRIPVTFVNSTVSSRKASGGGGGKGGSGAGGSGQRLLLPKGYQGPR